MGIQLLENEKKEDTGPGLSISKEFIDAKGEEIRK